MYHAQRGEGIVHNGYALDIMHAAGIHENYKVGYNQRK